MNTSVFALVLASTLLAAPKETPTWQRSYGQAAEQGAAQKKPVVIFFGSGGWSKVVRDAAPADDVTKLLADKYVCVYIDTATPEGKKLAADFGISSGLGLVVSDRAGTSQAFWHQGDMTSVVLARALQRYSDPSVIINRTETVTSARVSLYPPTAENSLIQTSPLDSYCPSCSNGGGGRFRR